MNKKIVIKCNHSKKIIITKLYLIFHHIMIREKLFIIYFLES